MGQEMTLSRSTGIAVAGAAASVTLALAVTLGALTGYLRAPAAQDQSPTAAVAPTTPTLVAPPSSSAQPALTEQPQMPAEPAPSVVSPSFDRGDETSPQVAEAPRRRRGHHHERERYEDDGAF